MCASTVGGGASPNTHDGTVSILDHPNRGTLFVTFGFAPCTANTDYVTALRTGYKCLTHCSAAAFEVAESGNKLGQSCYSYKQWRCIELKSHTRNLHKMTKQTYGTTRLMSHTYGTNTKLTAHTLTAHSRHTPTNNQTKNKTYGANLPTTHVPAMAPGGTFTVPLGLTIYASNGSKTGGPATGPPTEPPATAPTTEPAATGTATLDPSGNGRGSASSSSNSPARATSNSFPKSSPNSDPNCLSAVVNDPDMEFAADPPPPDPPPASSSNNRAVDPMP